MVLREIVAFALPRSFSRLRRDSFQALATVTTNRRSNHQQSVLTPEVVPSVVTPRPEEQTPPVLLLEGDEFYVSHDGIARTFYELDGDSKIAVEELYDLKHASKEFILREPLAYYSEARKASNSALNPAADVLSSQAQGVVPMGKSLASVTLQEIDEGPFGDAGTGATTWEASIAMALYFRLHPEQLLGGVIEVGCGIGLGGILNQMGRDDSSLGESMTLTDGNDYVLKQCQINVQKNINSGGLQGVLNPTSYPIKVSKLDWNEFIGEEKSDRPCYATVIACDCAYLHTNIESLGKTLYGLVDKTNPAARVHLFGPYNRSAFHEVIRYLTDELDMDVILDWIDMNRYRLKPGRRDSSKVRKLDDCVYASNNKAKFLHVRASIKQKSDNPKTCERHFSDID